MPRCLGGKLGLEKFKIEYRAKRHPHPKSAARSAAWCPGADSNRYAFRHRLLRPACLPIPPPGRVKRWQKTHLRGTAQDRIQPSEPGRAAKTGQNRRWPQGKRRRRKNNPSERSHAKARSREGREPIKADRTDGSLQPLCLCVSVVKPPGSEGLDLRPTKAVGPPRHRVRPTAPSHPQLFAPWRLRVSSVCGLGLGSFFCASGAFLRPKISPPPRPLPRTPSPSR